jgi:proteic killer suppression protein
MEIGSFRHKDLRRLFDDDDASKVDPGCADKLRLILAFLQDMAGDDELKAPPKWGAHPLTGDRKGAWSLTVTRNWRLTFRVDDDGALQDIDFEDYH